MKKVLLFTGAGMSVPLGLPSTIDFMESVNSGLQPVTRHIINHLNSSGHGNDIEWILSELQSFKNGGSLIEFLIPHAATDQSGRNGVNSITTGISNLRFQCDSELVRIKKIIFDKLIRYKSDDASSLYVNVVRELKDFFKDIRISIVTANYDLTFEDAFESRESFFESEGIKDIDFSFRTKNSRTVYDPSHEFDWRVGYIEYLKLHGSLDWHHDARGICTRNGSVTMPDKPDEMAILYPGFKGVPDKEPFITLHNKFDLRLHQADEVIVVCFAFRDSYINNIFERMLRAKPDSNVYVINPVKKENFPPDSQIPWFVNNFKNFKLVNRKVEISETPLGLNDIFGKKSQKIDEAGGIG